MLAEVELTLKREVEIALGMKAAEKTAKSLKEGQTTIQQISSSQRPDHHATGVGRPHMTQETVNFRMLIATDVENLVTLFQFVGFKGNPRGSYTRK